MQHKESHFVFHFFFCLFLSLRFIFGYRHAVLLVIGYHFCWMNNIEQFCIIIFFNYFALVCIFMGIFFSVFLSVLFSLRWRLKSNYIKHKYSMINS